MVRYLVFAGHSYYPAGGWDDYVGSYATLEDAISEAAAQTCDWFQIVDFETKTIVKDFW